MIRHCHMSWHLSIYQTVTSEKFQLYLTPRFECMRLEMQKETAWNKHILCFQNSYKNVGLQAKTKITNFKNVSQKSSFLIGTVISSASGGQNIFKLHLQSISALPKDWFGIWNPKHSDRYQKQNFVFWRFKMPLRLAFKSKKMHDFL